MIVEMGSFQFVVAGVNMMYSSISLCAFNSLNSQQSQFSISLTDTKKTFSFGRKTTNDFSFDDQHLSGIHAKIQIINGSFVLEDMSSTNGYLFVAIN